VIIAATVTGLLGLPMWFDMAAEYILGFAIGLFIFQALFMKDMFGGSYRTALRRSLLPEWVSMNAMMAGMFPIMVRFMMGRDMRAMDPHEPLSWGVMSLAIGVGFLTAYPVNWWLVQAGLKHGLMTVRPQRPEPPGGPDGRDEMELMQAQTAPAASASSHAGHMALSEGAS
jgi:hypothetical protein